jgi:hypothetical protein
MTGTATRYAIPVLQGSDRVNQTPQWTADVATKLAEVMDGGSLAPTFQGTWRQYHTPGLYQVSLEIDNAARRVHVVGFAEHQGSPLTLGSTPTAVWSVPGIASLNPAAEVAGMTWGTGGWVRWIITSGAPSSGPTLSILSPGANFGTQHPYSSGDFLSMASITWRYP